MLISSRSSSQCIFIVHDAAVVEHDGSAPSRDAVTVSPGRSVSEAVTVIFDVP